MSDAMIPVRHAVCLQCRTLLASGEACDGGKRHQVIDLRDPGQRKKLVKEVWGPANLRRDAKRLAKAGGTGAASGSIWNAADCGDCGGSGCSSSADAGEALVFFVVIILFAAVFMVIVWLVRFVAHKIRERQNRPRPFGATSPPKAIEGPGVLGVVRASEARASPVDGAPNVAYALEYRAKSVMGGDALLREASSAGFDVELGDGRVVHVPAGRIHLEGRAVAIDAREMNGAREHVDAIDPARATSADDDPFPFDQVHQRIVRPGDQVRICNELEVAPDPAAQGDYRAGAGMLVPRGVPELRVFVRREG